jgi:hypothetical protein
MYPTWVEIKGENLICLDENVTYKINTLLLTQNRELCHLYIYFQGQKDKLSLCVQSPVVKEN